MVTKSTVRVNPRLKTLADAFELKGPELKTISVWIDTAFRKHEKRLFATSGSHGGSKFAPLSDKYAKWKKRHFPGRQILSLTGGLRKSLSTKKHGHIARSYTQPRPTIVVGTTNELAAYHGPGRWRNPRLPLRDPMQHTRKQEQTYFDLAREYMADVKLPRVARIMAAWKAVRLR